MQRTILTLALALLVVFSSLGMTITRHLCDGEVMSLALFEHSVACEMEQQKEKLPPCHQPVADDDCCQNQTVLLEVEDQSAASSLIFKLSAPDVAFLAAFSVVWSTLFEMYDPAISLPPDYTPPLLSLDIPVLVQSFLL